MAQLIVRDLEEDLVRKLRVRAARHGKSADEQIGSVLK
jgi:plasmid stability protein